MKTVVTKTGRPEIATDPMGVELSDVIVMLNPEDTWTTASDREGLVSAISERLEDELPGMNFSFSQPIELRMAELLSGTRSDVAVTIYGDDLETLQRLSHSVQQTLRRVPGARDVRGEQLHGLPTLEVVVKRSVASRYGISGGQIMDAVEAIGGRQVGTVYEGERRFALQVRVPEDLRNDLDTLRLLPVGSEPGAPLVPLGQLADLRTSDLPASVSRDSVQRRTNVEVNVAGRDLAGFVARARGAVDEQVKFPPGYTVRWGGQFENLEQAKERLSFAVPVCLGLIFLMLYVAFGETKTALLIYLNVPVAAVGGVVALALRGMPLSISAAVGFIALFGIAVLNGVVLLTDIKRRRADGLDPATASKQAALSRMRAVVMTASVAALGFLPMALSTSAGAEVQRPLATVVIGGLSSATLLTLFVLPTLYAWLFRVAKPVEEPAEA